MVPDRGNRWCRDNPVTTEEPSPARLCRPGRKPLPPGFHRPPVTFVGSVNHQGQGTYCLREQVGPLFTGGV